MRIALTWDKFILGLKRDSYLPLEGLGGMLRDRWTRERVIELLEVRPSAIVYIPKDLVTVGDMLFVMNHK